MKLSISTDADPNYLAEVVTIENIVPHPNADRLEMVKLYGMSIIIAKDQYKVGDKVVYFPVESCIDSQFLSWANLFDKEELNEDRKTKGFFSNKGCRVNAVRLRGVASQGFLLKTSKVSEYYKCKEEDFKVGRSFDTVGEHRLSKKYIRPTVGTPSVKKEKIPRWISNIIDIFPRPIRIVLYMPVRYYYKLKEDSGIKSLIVDGQFHFHYKTENLGKNVFILKPNDNITISAKCHGTSAVFANILCKKELGFFKKLLRMRSKETEYRFVYSSRSVLKNRKDGSYTDDVWGKHAKELEGKIPEGVTIYGEIVGYTGTGGMIQSGYDYGVNPNESELWVYRITLTHQLGQIVEFDFSEIKKICENLGLKYVPVYVEGKVSEFYPEIPIDENWAKNFLEKLKDVYLDKQCEFCKTKVVNEGIVLKINNSDKKPVYKFKSPDFVLKESKSRDAGDVDMEEEA